MIVTAKRQRKKVCGLKKKKKDEEVGRGRKGNKIDSNPGFYAK